VEQVPSTFAEDLDKSLYTPATYVQENALVKAREVWETLHAEPDCARPVDMVIGSDTVVSVDDKILEKPPDAAAAMAMLSSLSGRRHRVYSGVAILHRSVAIGSLATPFSAAAAGDDSTPLGSGGCSEQAFVECTEVEFAALSEAEIAAYVATGEPFDKAGGYGIQSAGGAFVRKIDGDYFNVMGLPMHRTCEAIAALIQ
jgi:septum formation protein